MRLHNRLVKAEFWTDTDLLRNLDRDGRMFYLGLIQLADDSGCLDDDTLAFKVHLYPADMDVDLDFIQGYRDKLVEMGKLIPYTAGGKKCLYLRNFHKHQSLRSPAPPEVPLPDWVEWEPGTKPRSPGKYIVEEPCSHRKVTVRSPYGEQIELEREREREPERNLKHMCVPDRSECEIAPAEKPKKGGAQRERAGKGDYTPEFEQFWSVYPRRIEKKAAFRCWNTRAKEGVSHDDLITAAQNYAVSCREDRIEKRFIKHAKTFLGPSRPYEDYIAGPVIIGAREPPGPPEPAGFKVLREVMTEEGVQ